MLKVFKFFKTEGYGMPEFKEDWQSLTVEERAQLRKGIEEGTLTY